MLERKIRLTGKNPEHTAPKPTARKARVEGETTVDPRDGHIYVLAEKSEHEGSGGEDLRVVRADPKCSSGKIHTRAPARLTVVCPAVNMELRVAVRRQGKRGPVIRIAADRPLKQIEHLDDAVPLEGVPMRESAQVQIVCSEIVRGPVGRSYPG